MIENWRSKVGMENLGMLEIVLEIVEECDAVPQSLINEHLEALEGDLKDTFQISKA